MPARRSRPDRPVPHSANATASHSDACPASHPAWHSAAGPAHSFSRWPALLAGTALAAAAACASAADTTVYRCTVDGRVTYSDQPCAHHARTERVTVSAGDAAPDARERLRRDQEALDRGAAERRAALAREDELRRMQPQERAAPPPEYPASDPVYYPAYGYGYGYGVYYDGNRQRPRRPDRDVERRKRSVIPVPPPVPAQLMRR